MENTYHIFMADDAVIIATDLKEAVALSCMALLDLPGATKEKALATLQGWEFSQIQDPDLDDHYLALLQEADRPRVLTLDTSYE
jgi:hypothetical protein